MILVVLSFFHPLVYQYQKKLRLGINFDRNLERAASWAQCSNSCYILLLYIDFTGDRSRLGCNSSCNLKRMFTLISWACMQLIKFFPLSLFYTFKVILIATPKGCSRWCSSCFCSWAIFPLYLFYFDGKFHEKINCPQLNFYSLCKVAIIILKEQ